MFLSLNSQRVEKPNATCFSIICKNSAQVLTAMFSATSAIRFKWNLNHANAHHLQACKSTQTVRVLPIVLSHSHSHGTNFMTNVASLLSANCMAPFVQRFLMNLLSVPVSSVKSNKSGPMQNSPSDFLILLTSAFLEDPVIFKRTAELHHQIMQRPFPSPYIITELVTRKFPEFKQKHVYLLTQEIKKNIAELELCCNLANQNVKHN